MEDIGSCEGVSFPTAGELCIGVFLSIIGGVIISSVQLGERSNLSFSELKGDNFCCDWCFAAIFGAMNFLFASSDAMPLHIKEFCNMFNLHFRVDLM